MCTESNHVESAKAPVAANTQPTTAVVDAKPQKHVYSWEYESPNKLNLIKSNDASSTLDLSAGLNANQVAYYFDANNVPTHKRIVFQAIQSVKPDDIIFQQDFMKNKTPTPTPNSNSVITVSTFLTSDLKNPINTKTADDMAKAKRMLSRQMVFGEVRCIFVDGKPTRKRVYGGDSVDVEQDDPIFTALKPKVTEPTPAATPEPKFVAKVLDSNDLTQIIRQVNVKNERSLGDSKTGTLRSAKEIIYLFKDDQPIKLRKFMQSEQDVTSTDPIFATIQPKKKQYKVVGYRLEHDIASVDSITEFDSKNQAIKAINERDMVSAGHAVRYLFQDNIAIHKRVIQNDLESISANDKFFPNRVPMNMPQETAKPEATTNVETEKPATIQEFLAKVMKRHREKNYRLLNNEAFNEVVQEMWPEKKDFIFNTGDKTTYYMMLQLLNEWNPPAKPKVKRYQFSVGKRQHDFITSTFDLLNGVHPLTPSDKLISDISKLGIKADVFASDWNASLRLVLALHSKNANWLKNGVHKEDGEEYKLEHIDIKVN